MKLVSNIYDIKSNKVKKSIKLYHFTDTHFTNKTKRNGYKNLINSIIHENPDYVIFTGDIIDSPKRIDEEGINKVLDLLKHITKRYPLIYISGNHEIKEIESVQIHLKPFFDGLKKIDNLYHLDGIKNKKIEFKNVVFYGFDLDFKYYYEDMEENPFLSSKIVDSFKIDNTKYNVLLCHTPSVLKDRETYIKKGFDLILMGHMHNGLVPSYFNNKNNYFGILSPRKKLFPKYSRNMFSINNTNVLIGYPYSFNHLVEEYNFNFIFRPGFNIINVSNK